MAARRIVQQKHPSLAVCPDQDLTAGAGGDPPQGWVVVEGGGGGQRHEAYDKGWQQCVQVIGRSLT